MKPDNAAWIVSALQQFGFGTLGLKEVDFLEVDTIIQLGDPPRRIDLPTTLPGVDFEACYGTRLVIELDDLAVNFIDLENLKRNKRASGRAQDQADLENLEG